MKTVFELDDLLSGKILGKAVKRRTADEPWLIGYDAAVSNEKGTGKRYGLISLYDGMFSDHFTQQGLIDHLNQHEYELQVEAIRPSDFLKKN